jgi:hypothetical protein
METFANEDRRRCSRRRREVRGAIEAENAKKRRLAKLNEVERSFDLVCCNRRNCNC